MGRQLAAAGFSRLVLFNGHGGQIALLQVAVVTWFVVVVLPMGKRGAM